MKLKNVMLVVDNVERSVKFYKDIFGLEVILRNDGNVIMTEGLVLQDRSIWEKYMDGNVVYKNHAAELYFEEYNLEVLQEKLDKSGYEIEYVTRLMTYPWGQKVIRLYDLDKHLIEIGEKDVI